MKEPIAIGDILWCCKPLIESEAYGDLGVVEPWRGKVTGRPAPFTIRISKVDANDVADDDSNATSYAKAEDLFATEQEARDYYRSRIP